MKVIKYVLAAATALVLSGCGGKTMIESDMSRMVSASPASPWLTVDNRGETVVTVTGLDSTVKVQVSPDIASVVQARLRSALQPKYITDLIINCRGLQAATVVVVMKDGEPAVADMELVTSCRIVARGLVASKGYRIQQSLPVDLAAPRVDVLVSKLIDGASSQLADKLWADVLATGVQR
ncbi:hypothetical protein [Luteibacter sp. E-22]|uniref:hypothetical protein n=1 Tax=Luteibacter sp. E-22 TaxID=3404050 RepID=UPI003CEC0F6C